MLPYLYKTRVCVFVLTRITLPNIKQFTFTPANFALGYEGVRTHEN